MKKATTTKTRSGNIRKTFIAVFDDNSACRTTEYYRKGQRKPFRRVVETLI